MNSRLKIVADENMPALDTMFGNFDVVKVAGRDLSAEQVKDADILLVRSVTKVTESLLSSATHLKMVGTATIGMDHLDQAYLSARGIPFFNAPGCNADAVVDYVLSVIYNLLDNERSIESLTVGIIGVGNVGGRLHNRLSAAGINTLLNDPPREEAEGAQGFTDLARLLETSDIICMHTPLVSDGKWPSHHLLNEQELMQIKPNALLINAGRGPVINNKALSKVLDVRDDLTVALDVWEHEPTVDAALASKVAIGSPHIAGYSLDGKLRGTHMLRQRLAMLFDLPSPRPLRHFLPDAGITSISVSSAVTIRDVMNTVYHPFSDDKRFRKTLAKQNQPHLFDQLRKQYPVRREFSTLIVKGVDDPKLQLRLKAFGFSLD